MGLKTNNKHYSALLPKLKEKSHIGVKKDILGQKAFRTQKKKKVTFQYIGESPENFMSKYTQEV